MLFGARIFIPTLPYPCTQYMLKYNSIEWGVKMTSLIDILPQSKYVHF